MEDRGLQSSAILVRGVQTGKVEVSSRLMDTHVALTQAALSSAVPIAVLEPLQIEPAHDIYLAKNMCVKRTISAPLTC